LSLLCNKGCYYQKYTSYFILHTALIKKAARFQQIYAFLYYNASLDSLNATKDKSKEEVLRKRELRDYLERDG
jgi:hypothetical protein